MALSSEDRALADVYGYLRRIGREAAERDDPPLDVDGVLSLSEHQAVCRKPRCLFCDWVGDDAMPTDAGRSLASPFSRTEQAGGTHQTERSPDAPSTPVAADPNSHAADGAREPGLVGGRRADTTRLSRRAAGIPPRRLRAALTPNTSEAPTRA